MAAETPRFGERAEYGADDVCYRHRDRPTFTLCQRCGKNICTDCQVISPVGVLCPDCVAAQQKRASSAHRSAKTGKRTLAADATPVTYGLMIASLVVFAAQYFFSDVTRALWYAPLYSLPAQFEPWRMVTAMFTHSPSSIFHILFNLYALWLFGRELERFAGKLYFSIVYLFAGLGGSLAVMFWGYSSIDALRTPTVGASGAIFGVLGATLVVMKVAQINARSLVVLIGINVVIGFLPGTNISWQAHLGGLIVGALAMYLLVQFRGPRQKVARVLSLSALGVVLVALSFAFFVIDPLAVLGLI